MNSRIGIKFNTLDMPKYFRPDDKEIAVGEFYVVENPFGDGEKVGVAASIESRCPHANDDADVPRIIRQASPKEIIQWRKLKQRESESLQICKAMVVRHKLDMKVSVCRIEEQENKIVFNFTADQRVDFRELVKELASALKSRIELWQIGVRDEAKMLGGCGLCGQQLCCAGWIKEFQPVSIKHARAQDILRAPAKLAGMCGRLRCCMTYEYQVYCELRKGAPKVGSRVCGNGVEGVVSDRNLLKKEVMVYDHKQSRLVSIPFSDVKPAGEPSGEKTAAPPDLVDEPRKAEPRVPAAAAKADASGATSTPVAEDEKPKRSGRRGGRGRRKKEARANSDVRGRAAGDPKESKKTAAADGAPKPPDGQQSKIKTDDDSGAPRKKKRRFFRRKSKKAKPGE